MISSSCAVVVCTQWSLEDGLSPPLVSFPTPSAVEQASFSPKVIAFAVMLAACHVPDELADSMPHGSDPSGRCANDHTSQLW